MSMCHCIRRDSGVANQRFNAASGAGHAQRHQPAGQPDARRRHPTRAGPAAARTHPGKRPRYDYFEDEAIVQLQDAACWTCSATGAATAVPSAAGAAASARAQFRQKLAELIPLRLQKDAMWLVKDPRSAVLVEDWLEVRRP